MPVEEMCGNCQVRSLYAVLFNAVIAIPISLVLGRLCVGNTSSCASSNFTCCFVDCKPWRYWSRLPFEVGTVGPTNLSKFILVIPGYVTNLPLPIALLKVETTGLKAHSCKYFARSVFDCDLFTMMSRTCFA